MSNRREFFSNAAGAAFLGSISFSGHELELMAQAPPAAQWDLSWVSKIRGKHKVVLDVPAIESGNGVFRATIWMQQYADVMKVSPNDLTSILVLRHDGITLAMQQKFWDEYGIGKAQNVIHPVTREITDRNPALMSSTRPGDGIPARLDGLMLDKYMERGGIVLGCALAFDVCVRKVVEKDKTSPEVARAKAMSMLVPGVTLQPSGVFAVIRAQEAGCAYVRAS